jgi:hemolysin activation/secretion protein
MSIKALIFLASCCIWLSLYTAPPPVPSAGVVEREIEKEYEGKALELDKQEPLIQIDIPDEKLEMEEGKKIFIRQVSLEGNTSISSKKILTWISSFLNKELSLKNIYELCHVIDQHYAKEGYFLARAYPPPQNIEKGVLTIKIIEGRLGRVSVVGNKFYKTEFIKSYFNSLLNKPLKKEAFMRALMLLNDNTDLVAGAIFEKGKEFGCADVIIRVKDSKPMHLYFNGNNYGRNLTTNARGGGRFDWGNVLVQGDKFSIAEVLGLPVSALYFTDVRYLAPINKNGASLEGAYLFSKFKIQEDVPLHLKGSSSIATLKFNQALTRKPTLSTDFFAFFDYKQIKNYTLDYLTSFDKLRVLTLGAFLDHFDRWNGRDYFKVQLAAGVPYFLGGMAPVDPQSSRVGGGGRFVQLNVDYDRLQRLPKEYYLYFHGSAQISPSYLTLPQQIYLGGVDTVRGYPLAAALGDNGYYLNLEFRIPPPFFGESKFFKSKMKWKEVLQFDVFLDHGGAALQSIATTFLTGTGLGLRLNGPYGLSFSIDVGFPLSHRSLTTSAFTYIKLTARAF